MTFFSPNPSATYQSPPSISNFVSRVFTSSDSLNVTGGTLISDLLIVAGGGGNPGYYVGGGGGAGGVVNYQSEPIGLFYHFLTSNSIYIRLFCHSFETSKPLREHKSLRLFVFSFSLGRNNSHGSFFGCRIFDGITKWYP